MSTLLMATQSTTRFRECQHATDTCVNTTQQVSQMLQKGVNVNTPLATRHGDTLLMAACALLNVKLAKLLLAWPRIEVCLRCFVFCVLCFVVCIYMRAAEREACQA
jgi:hypothetical protein